MGPQGAPGQEYGAQTQDIAEHDRGRTEAGRRQAVSQSDIAIARQVAQRLQQETGQRIQIEMPGTIYVRVADGTVTLDGFVPSSNIRDRAVRVADAVQGVRHVRDSLNIGTAGGQAFGYLAPYGTQPGYQQFGNEYGYRYGQQPYGYQYGGPR